MARNRKVHLADMHLPWSPLNAPPIIVDASAGVLDWGSRRRVCLYGAGIGRKFAPLDDSSWCVWAANVMAPLDGHRRIRADLWWDIHQRQAQSQDDLRWIAALPIPIMVPADLLDANPKAVRYPVERVEHAFASYFACTFAYQIAYALLAGFTDIGLYGVELALGTKRERTVEYACVSWWMGYAKAKGVTFHLPRGSRLSRHPFRYGLEYEAEKKAIDGYVAMLDEIDAMASTTGMGG